MRAGMRWAGALAGAMCGLLVSGAWADDGAARRKAVAAQLATVLPGVTEKEIHEVPATGLYEVTIGNGTAYVTQDGKHLLRGDLIEIPSLVNLTEQRHNGLRRDLLAKLRPGDVIAFSPARPAKHHITVFTDVDCAYCRRLHQNVAKYTEAGVEVRYVAYPREGAGSEAWDKAEAVWCAGNPREALTRAKRGEAVQKAARCDTSHVSHSYLLASQMGIQGTPLIVLDDGSRINGYLPAEELLPRILGKEQK